MEYLPGGDLHRAVLSQKLDRAAGLRAILAVGDALAYSHSRGLVHRDVKPHNILLDEQNEAQLSDFDLVWAPDTTGGTRTSAMGTFLLAAPEEMEDASQVDHRADIYSLAMTTVFVLFGRNLSRRVLDDREGFIATLDAGTSVKELLKQATAPEQESRPATVAAFCQALTAALDSEDNDRVAVAAPEVISAVSAHAEPEPPARVITIRKKFGREEVVWIGGLLLVLLVAGGILWWLMR
jgi:serine/threonine protein kinase